MTTAHRILCIALAWAALAFACSDPPPKREWKPADHAQPEEPDPSRQAAEPEAAQESQAETVARAAAALWNASCASCHGREGQGQGPARPPGARIADFTAPAWQTSRTDAQLAQVIRDGRGMMPPFGKQLSDDGVRALVSHIRRFGATEDTAAAAQGAARGQDQP